MLSACNVNGYVLASQVTKEDGPFTCPMCECSTVVKKGRVKIHHFAHIPPSDCAYGMNESEEHRQAKVAIYDAMTRRTNVSKLQLERPLGDIRPDISFYLNNVPVAVEVQISTLSLDIIDKRTKAYAKKGIYLLWTSPYSSNLTMKPYSPALWEKYLHAMYFGKLYYWVEGEIVQPIRFEDYKIHVEAKSWYDSDGEEHSAGGYDRYSKRYRTVRNLPRTGISSMVPVYRKPWEGKGITIPPARLWCEPYPDNL